jgi:quaternary ammonium compound-resistance protein SugE
MSWLLLVVAGCLEVAWAIGLKYTHGFTRPIASVLTASAIVASMLMLARAAKEIPIGTAYAVWVGIGALGTAGLGVFLFGEPASTWRVVFMALLVLSIVGLKLTSA